MRSEAQREVEAKLLGLLRNQASCTMPAAELIRAMTRDGVSEMDAREALLSLMATDEVTLTADRQVRTETEAVR